MRRFLLLMWLAFAATSCGRRPDPPQIERVEDAHVSCWRVNDPPTARWQCERKQRP